MPQYQPAFASPNSLPPILLAPTLQLTGERVPLSHTLLPSLTRPSPICPQLRSVSLESELLGIVENELPKQFLAQNEFECLNLNITRPATTDKNARLPVMVWVHGFVDHSLTFACPSLMSSISLVVGPVALARAGYMTVVPSSKRASTLEDP